jgi:hypothetical protein
MGPNAPNPGQSRPRRTDSGRYQLMFHVEHRKWGTSIGDVPRGTFKPQGYLSPTNSAENPRHPADVPRGTFGPSGPGSRCSTWNIGRPGVYKYINIYNTTLKRILRAASLRCSTWNIAYVPMVGLRTPPVVVLGCSTWNISKNAPPSCPENGTETPVCPGFGTP